MGKPVSIVSLMVLAVFCRFFWLQPFRDVGRCMEPTVKVGDLFIVNRLSYSTRKPERGDVVFVDATKLPLKQAHPHKRWIKRVVGVPGDRISIHPPYIHIKGSPLADPEIFVPISELKKDYQGYVLPDPIKYPDAILKKEEDEVTLAGDEYFLIGDNTTNSLDSRHFGAVPRAAILGRVICVIAPGNRRGIIK